MKARGLRLYLLSNAPVRYLDFKKNLPILRMYDGEVISALIGHSKPGREFFQYALTTFSLNPEECFFVDDLKHNVAGAKACGIESVVFDGDYRALMKRIDQENTLPISR
jgi:putative hydrolase of the HAD superfamily